MKIPHPYDISQMLTHMWTTSDYRYVSMLRRQLHRVGGLSDAEMYPRDGFGYPVTFAVVVASSIRCTFAHPALALAYSRSILAHHEPGEVVIYSRTIGMFPFDAYCPLPHFNTSEG